MDRSYDQLLFIAASSLAEGEERQTFLDHACRDEPELRRRVEGLFEVQDEAAAYLEPANQAADRQSRDENGELDTKVGRYRLVDRLGEGGYGVVYLAEQSEPVRRRVALKIIRPGMDTEQVIARFETERQSLAMMDHRNIARVLDAGATSSGRPFFVMELVDGQPIAEFCDQRRIGIRGRLEIFERICHAVQHAHQKGVIHRDLKPSNILVELQEGVAVPKVIDFGIAKAAKRGGASDHTLTTSDQFLGTPAYMSPEVAAGGGDVDTRCDIHSLGAVLFELLTGRAPLTEERAGTLGMDEIRRILREEEAPIASAALASLDVETQDEVSRARGLNRSKLFLQIRGDLDWIVAKAMARERDRRYESAQGLALDVRRHLDCEPVRAGPPDPLYRLSKLVRRNRRSFISGAISVTALLIGFSISTVLFFREKEALALQEELGRRAEIARSAEERLRRRAEYRERISNAAVQVSHGDLEAADQLLQSVPFGQVPPSLEAAEAYLRIGEWHVLAERWEQAANCFANLAVVLPTIDPADSFDISVVVIRAAALLCHTDDLARYDTIREHALERFSDTQSPVVAEQVFKATLLRPPAEETWDELQELGEFLESSLTKSHPELRNNDFRISWCRFALGLMKYREGDLEAAAMWTERAFAISGGHVPRETMLRCVRAMIAARHGDSSEARTLLEEASRAIEDYSSKPIELGDAMSSWSDWLIARLLYQEARELTEE